MTAEAAAPASAWPDLERLLPEATARRRLLQRMLGLGQRPIVIASMSRSGSTMLYKAVAASWGELRFGSSAARLMPLFTESAWKLDETPLIGGVLYKTHDLPEHLPRGARAKVIFTYRKASDVALSIADRRAQRGEKWFLRHRIHLRGKGDYETFLKKDSLGLEAQIDRWSEAQGLDVLGLRYETLWDHAREIDDFLGFKVQMPENRGSLRKPEPTAIAEQLTQTYAALDRKIAAMPDLFRLKA
jgi:hypothetical protein